ncbi:MAG TPA: TRAM domain-containing protein [Phycisphaerales bacterium]|nr:TRAM domain-containing protein [Phycisphaerales bacterium]
MNDQPSTEANSDEALPVLPGVPERRRYTSPSEQAEADRRRQRIVLLAVRMLFLVMLVTVSLLPFVGTITGTQSEATFWSYVIPFGATFVFGVAVVLIDAATPNKRLATVFASYAGIIAGLVGALAVGTMLDLVAKSWDLTTPSSSAYLGLIKLAIGITMCYLAVSIVLTTKDDFRLAIPYVEFAKQVRGVRPLLLDTSTLIDGRIHNVGQTGMVDAPLIVPQFVIDELQTLADSADKLKRARGRRGLAMVSQLQTNPYVAISIDTTEVPRRNVDQMLVQMAAEQSLRILTTDYNLNKVAQIRGVTVLNLNDVANALKSQAIPGESLVVEIVKRGEAAGQGVGYMPDGTMVVVEDAAERIGQNVTLTVTNSLTTSAGRMIFGTATSGVAKTASGDDADANSHVDEMARAATHQPRTPVRSSGRADDPHDQSRRNPRRT